MIKTMEVGQLMACCYIIANDQPGANPAPCVVIDPGDEPERITLEVKRLNLRVEMILLTHAHPDHIGGVRGLLLDWPDAVLACSEKTSRRAGDARLNLSALMGANITCGPATRVLQDGESFTAAGMEWKAIIIPGHEPGEMVYILGKGDDVFTGDTLFAGSIGRSDFPGGDGHALIAGVIKLLNSLPSSAAIYPGHGPSTTAGQELAHNPFLRGGW